MIALRLTRVLIENFRGIGRLDVELDTVTAVIGENNTGKTSLFDVLGLILGRGEPLEGRLFRRDDFHLPPGHARAEPIRILLCFEVTEADPVGGDPPAFAAAIHEDAEGTRRVRAEFTGEPEGRRIEARFVDAGHESIEGVDTASAVTDLRRLHPVLLLRFAQPSQPVHVDPADSSTLPAERRGRRGLEAQIARVYRDLVRARGPVPPEQLAGGLDAARELVRTMRTRNPATRSPMRDMLDHLLDDPGLMGRDEQGSGRVARAGSGSHTLGLLMVLGAMLDVRGDEILPDGASPLIAIEEPEVHLHPILLASTWDVIESLQAQTVVTTNSGELLSSVPMQQIRRLVRRDQAIAVYQLRSDRLSDKERRRVGYHIGAKRGSVLFARCWLLVEGETEFWILRHLAHVLGLDLEAEGVRLVEFAQCGIAPLVKLANDLGIEWHLLADGDESGAVYAHEARDALVGRRKEDRISRLGYRDIESLFWHHGYQQVYCEAARWTDRQDGKGGKPSPGRVISKAARLTSKPALAQRVAEAAAERGPEGVPEILRRVITTSVGLARDASTDGTEIFEE